MSIQAMQWVIEHSQHSGTELLTLLMLANHAGTERWEAWPSVRLLARECRMSERQIQRNLRRLEAAGEVRFIRGGGRNGTNLYQVLGVTAMTGRQSDTPAADVTRGVKPTSPKGRLPRHPNRKEPSVEPSSLSFDAFYEAFPRHQGKGSAKKAYAKALSKASPEELLLSATHYRNDPNREPGFTCLPATWLNQERWTDDPLPSRNGDKPISVSVPRSRRTFELTDEELEAMRG